MWLGWSQTAIDFVPVGNLDWPSTTTAFSQKQRPAKASKNVKKGEITKRKKQNSKVHLEFFQMWNWPSPIVHFDETKKWSFLTTRSNFVWDSLTNQLVRETKNAEKLKPKIGILANSKNVQNRFRTFPKRNSDTFLTSSELAPWLVRMWIQWPYHWCPWQGWCMLPGSLANLSWLDCFRHHFMKPGFFFTIAKKSSAQALSQQRRAVRLSALHARAPHGHHFDQIQAPSCVSPSHLRNSTQISRAFYHFLKKNGVQKIFLLPQALQESQV